MKTKYAFQGMKENMARAISKDLGISTKVSIEISNFLRGKKSDEAKNILDRVLKKKQAIPFKRFTDGVGHRKGTNVAAGRFPEKASEAFLTIIKQCEANAQAKGLSSDLRIVHLVVQKGTNAFRQGRQRRRKYKRTHLEIVLEEMEKESKKMIKKEKSDTSQEKEKVAEVDKSSDKKESKPVESKPVESKPVESKPVKKEETKTVIKETKPKQTDSGSVKEEKEKTNLKKEISEEQK